MKKNFLSTLSKAINTYLALDPESQTRLKKLQGKHVAIEFLPFHLMFYCTFDLHGIILKNESEELSETIIHGTPLQMFAMAMTKENRQRFFAEDLSIEGNAELGQQVLELFDHIQIDWEEPLSQLIGDVPAHHAGEFLRKTKNWLRESEKSFAYYINEYVHEEKNWFPTRHALQDFFNDIDTLRMDTDRMEIKINQLRTEIKGEA